MEFLTEFPSLGRADLSAMRRWIDGNFREFTRAMLPELWPFDYGRFEFRYTPTTGEVLFMEVNLSCNLWSKKTVSGAAQLAGLTHQQLLEHIAAYSMDRQGVIKAERTPFAPTVMPEEVGGEMIEV